MDIKSEKPKPSNEQSLGALFLRGKWGGEAESTLAVDQTALSPAPLNHLQNSHTGDVPLPPQQLLEPLNIIKTATGSPETPDLVDFPDW